MHGGEIIPNEHVALPPLVRINKLRLNSEIHEFLNKSARLIP